LHSDRVDTSHYLYAFQKKTILRRRFVSQETTWAGNEGENPSPSCEEGNSAGVIKKLSTNYF
jgi:hypothetical protein